MSTEFKDHPPYKLTVGDDGTFQVKAGESLSKYNWAIDGVWGNDASWNRFRRPGGSEGKEIIPKSLIKTGETLLYLPLYRKGKGTPAGPGVPETPEPAPPGEEEPDPGGPPRRLTPGEKSILQSVFGSGNRWIQYDKVWVRNTKYSFFQPNDNCCCTPDGTMYWGPNYQEDFSNLDLDKRAWLVHEGAHLYQFYGLHWPEATMKKQGVLNHFHYDYRLDPAKKDLSDYGMEQMGDIARDYYYLKCGINQVDGGYGDLYVLDDYLHLLPLR